ncbi:hypothetical protein QT327_10680 [Olivibacter sp. 47]|uniref:hypothetical protein n=1 Tax=Olivibacter sp. 47 TaxID=3056486 RepID=UPI0025A4CB19|nr:hypothetical protein [Olivibacter sp. 47]MDM8174815.1 hypothetical protein [Olivibacter sp. 47]
MKCNCVNIDFGSPENYAQAITVQIPDHMSDYREARLESGLSDTVSIDPCIFDEIKYLWANGIVTYGSCCGHNKAEPFVNVDESCINDMLRMGYTQNHPDPNRKDTFRLKWI